MRRVRGFLLLLLLAHATPSPALKVQGLYEAEVPVVDQSAAARQQAVSGALRLVLVKLTGDRNITGTVSVAPLLAAAERYVQQFRYGEATVPSTGPGAAARKESRLWVRFDENALNRDLRDIGVPIWGSERPSTLLWLVIAEGTGRNWAIEGEHDGYLSVIEARAAARGIPLLFPLFDLEDGAALQTSDVRGGFAQPVLDASRRYNADAVLAATLESPVPGIWEARWTAWIGEETLAWTGEGDIPESLLEEGMDGIADMLAARYAGTHGTAEASAFEITVVNVESVDHYARALKYLQSLNSVADVQVAVVREGSVRFSLRAHGGEAALAQAFALGRTLERVDGAEDGTYRLLP
jgi:hypothetical protein